MPGFDGTGPQGKGPITGKGLGFCVLKGSEDKPGLIEGLAGIQGKPIGSVHDSLINREVNSTPGGDGTGLTGLSPAAGRWADFYAGYPLPGFMNPVIAGPGLYGSVSPVYGFYRAGFTGYPLPCIRGFGFRRRLGRGPGRGRGRFGFRW